MAVARGLGIGVDEPRVLSDEQNLLVHLEPSPVVARVATRIAWSRPDPAAWLAREVAVARYAARHGAPVVPPAKDVDPGPHIKDGFALTLWTHVKTREELASETVVGEALARLHLAMREFPAESLPPRLPVHAQIENGLAALERDEFVAPRTLATLHGLHREMTDELAEVQGTNGVLHGDAHPWNLLRTPEGWRWIDMEETGYGPQEFDLAVLAVKVDDPEAALGAYAAAAGRPVVDISSLAPFQRIRELESVVWGLGMAVTDPSYRHDAQDRLARLLKSAN
jgi:Ser/Thr protein kinase RdoA (MazF antagonist)